MSTSLASPAATVRPDDEAAQPDVSVVMPCLNEEATIAACIARAREGLARLGATGEIIVADNGSTDQSVARAIAAGARVVHAERRGYGHAYRAGIAAARGRIVVMGDADNTYDFAELDALVRPLDQGADLVIGSRLRGTIAPGAMPWLHRRVGTPLLSLVLNLFFGTRLVDTLSGFRAFRRADYARLDLRCGGMEWGSEMIVAGALEGWRMVEVPVRYGPRTGQSKLRSFRDGWRYLRMMLMYSPRHLFFLPGGAMGLSGLALILVLLPGPIRHGRFYMDFHFMFVGSLLAILGTQIALLGVFARSERTPPGWFTLERGLAVGLALFVLGLLANAWILVRWIAASFGPMNMVRPAILALTLMSVGAQIFFSSFYLGLIHLGKD
jgi:glycosyltransferase involved in cell wall biosynthesis